MNGIFPALEFINGAGVRLQAVVNLSPSGQLFQALPGNLLFKAANGT
jgi:hypothetical protein